MKKYIFILLILFITGCSKNDDDTFLNFSPESSNNILAEIYTFSDGSKLLSQFSNIELKLSEGNIDLTIALQQQLISVEEIIEKMDYLSEINDGGSKLYFYDKSTKKIADENFYLVKCHSIDSSKENVFNKNIIIGKNEKITEKCIEN